MSRPSTAGDALRRLSRDVRALVDWHDSRPRASLTSLRGWTWIVLIAALLFWMSNPLVMVPTFYTSLAKSVIWTKVAIIVTLPFLRLPRVPWPWLLFLGLCYASQLWTINDFNTDVSNLVYVEIAAMAFIIAANCEPLVVCWGMGLGGVVVVALSVYAYLQEMPGASNAWIGGAEFTGIGTNENILAYTLVVSLAAMAAAGPPRHRLSRAAWVLVLAVNGGGIYLAQSGAGFLSAAGIVLAAAAIAVWPLARTWRRQHVLASAGAAGSVTIAGSLLVLVVLGKELSTLSGRVPFWRATIDTTLDLVPWVGAGWGAVWEHPWNGAPFNHVAEQIYTRAGYPLPHGHNFLLDVLPELGLAGVTVALLMIGYALREVTRAGVQPGSVNPVAGRLVLLVLVALSICGVTEPMLTVPLGWWSFALVVAVARQRTLVSGGGRRRSRDAVSGQPTHLSRNVPRPIGAAPAGAVDEPLGGALSTPEADRRDHRLRSQRS